MFLLHNVGLNLDSNVLKRDGIKVIIVLSYISGIPGCEHTL